jgi:hypothetical protein
MIRFSRPVPRAACAALMLLLAASVQAAPAWKGKEERVDGKLVVHNPAAAIDAPMTIALDEVFRLGGWDGGEDEFFGVISAIVEDEQKNLYVLDAQLHEVKVYDAAGAYLRTIGREGEGPGEFRGGAGLFWLPNGDLGVAQAFPGRIVTLTREGQPGSDYRLEAGDDGANRALFGAQKAGDHLAVIFGGFSFNNETMMWSQTRTLGYFDAAGKQVATLTVAELSMNMQAPVVSEKMFDGYWTRWGTSADGRTALAPALHAYQVDLFAPDGEFDRTILREYPVHSRTAEQKEELLEIYKGFTRNQIPNPNTTYEIEDVHPPVDRMGVHFRPDGSLWVGTSRGTIDAPDDQIGVFDVYDPKGRYVRQVTLKGQFDSDNDAVFFVGDRIIVITEFLSAAMAAQGGGAREGEEEKDAEPMSLICYRSSQLDAAAGIPGRSTTDSR